MMSLDTRFKAAVLAVSMLAAGQASAFSLQTINKISMPKKLVMIAFTAGLIRLWTKGSAWDYKMSDWKEDLKNLMKEYNIFDIESYKKLVAMIDKYIVGRQVSIIDATTYRSKNENGEIITLKRKKCDHKPFGLLGLFDAYILLQLEKLAKVAEHSKNSDNFFKMFDDAPAVEKHKTINVVLVNQQ